MSYGNGGSFDPGSVPGGQRPYPQSYNDPNFPHQQPPRSGNRTLFWVLGIIAALFIAGVIACCGFVYLGVPFVSNQLANQLRPQLQNSPEIVEHIGEIQDMTLNPQAMQQEDQSGKMVFDLQGTKGNGQVVVDPAQFGANTIDEGLELVLPDGRRIPITGPTPVPQHDGPVPVDPEQADPDALDEPRLIDAPPENATPPEAQPAAPADVEPQEPTESESPAEANPAA